MHFLADYGMFLLETLTLVISILILLAGCIAIASKGKHKDKDKINIKNINEHYDILRDDLRDELFDKSELKKLKKQEKRENKINKKAEKNNKTSKKKIFVLDFHGDIKASAVKQLREAITAILTTATQQDEVVVRLESGGGMVHSYGLAASQLDRLQRQSIPLTVAVDKVAASGGYMMACVADKILSAPFAIIGSIGVLAQLPNFNKWLKKHDIDFEQLSAGPYKRTLTVFGENDNKGREKMQSELEETHVLFKQFIKDHRTQVDIDQVATGEHWYGQRALELKLVDELITSDDYLLKASKTCDIFELSFRQPKSLLQKLTSKAQNSLQSLLNYYE